MVLHRIDQAVDKDNPWGLDQSQYYIELGGVSKFLRYKESLVKKENKEEDELDGVDA